MDVEWVSYDQLTTNLQTWRELRHLLIKSRIQADQKDSCEAVDCFKASVVKIFVRVGTDESIPLKLCKDCAVKFSSEG